LLWFLCLSTVFLSTMLLFSFYLQPTSECWVPFVDAVQ
jgi:hypothetical protein